MIQFTDPTKRSYFGCLSMTLFTPAGGLNTVDIFLHLQFSWLAQKQKCPWAKTTDFKPHISRECQLSSCYWNVWKWKWMHFSRNHRPPRTSKITNKLSYVFTNQKCQQRNFITVIIVNISLSLHCFVERSLRLRVTELLCLIKIKTERMCT